MNHLLWYLAKIKMPVCATDVERMRHRHDLGCTSLEKQLFLQQFCCSHFRAPPPTSSIILTAVTATLPGSSAGARSSRTGRNTLISQDPPLNNPIQMIHSVTQPRGMMNPASPPPNKPSTAIQISSLDSFRLQAASSYRPTRLWGAGRRGLSFDLQSC